MRVHSPLRRLEHSLFVKTAVLFNKIKAVRFVEA